jgi:N-acetylglutamate synthase-like GNAT family acetyltransferase
MNVIDLEPEYHETYFNCLEDWSDEIKEAGDHKACWYHKYKEKGLKVKIALDEKDTAIGMIQYLPIEESFVKGKDLCFILCIWVHGHKEGMGNRQGKGVGKALLEAAENDAVKSGYKGMAAWGLWLPFWMKASWFKKHGYKKAERDSMALLVWKPFSSDAGGPPSWVRKKKEIPIKPGQVTITAFISGWCSAQNMVYERAKRAGSQFGDKVAFESIDTSEREVFLEWGISDGIFIDGKQVSNGPPLSYEKLMKMISRKVKRLSS